MTSKKELRKIIRGYAKGYEKLEVENTRIIQEYREIYDAWSAYRDRQPDFTGIVNALDMLVAVESKRNALLEENEARRELLDRLLSQATEGLDDSEAQDIQREAVERDYGQFEENLASMLHRAEDEGDNDCVIMGAESDGNVKAWIRVLFTEAPEGVDYMASAFSYRGKNYLEYGKWNETKLRDSKLAKAEDELEKLRDSLKWTAEKWNEAEKKVLELLRPAYTAVAKRASTVQDSDEVDWKDSNLDDPRYRAAVEAMEDLPHPIRYNPHARTKPDSTEPGQPRNDGIAAAPHPTNNLPF